MFDNNLKETQEKATSEPESTTPLQENTNLLKQECASKITAKRGRLIRQLKSEIAKIKSKPNLTDDDLEKIQKLEELLGQELKKHKEQLKDRYKQEFSKKKATVPAIFTVLPKGIAIQMKRVVNCINELKEAKNNKQRIFKTIGLAKQIGLLASTPVIFTAKFTVRHWYVLMLLLSLLKSNFGSVKFKPSKGDQQQNEWQSPERVPFPIKDLEDELNKVLDPNHAFESSEDLYVQPTLDVPTVEVPTLDQTPSNIVESSPETVLEPVKVIEPVSVPINVSGTVPTENHYSLLKELLPDEYKNYTVYNTYEEAIQSIIDTTDLSRSEAINYLNGGTGHTPSIIWLVGENGFYADSYAELMKNYSISELEQLIEENKSTIEQVFKGSQKNPNLNETIQTLSGTAFIACLAYELLQSGLEIPKPGSSLSH